MKKILVPIDFSANANNALHYAAAMATKAQCSLTLVHVIPVQVAGVTEAPIVITPDSDTVGFYAEKLAALAKQLELEYHFQFEIETVCLTGLFLDKLLRLIRHQQIDLVVMGTAGANSFIDKVIGTNTISLIRSASCPVLAIPANASFNGIRKITYATDLNPKEVVFLRKLNQFAAPLNPEISLVHIEKKHHHSTLATEQQMQRLVEQFPDRHYTLAHARADNTAAGILQFARESSSDVLAVALQERSVLEDFFHTSVSRQVAMQCLIPLLTLPEKDMHPAGAGEKDAHAWVM